MASADKPSGFWKFCDICGAKVPSYAFRDHMIFSHPETMRERGEIGEYFDKRAMRVFVPGMLLLMLLGALLIFFTEVSGAVIVTVFLIGVAVLVVYYFIFVQMPR